MDALDEALQYRLAHYEIGHRLLYGTGTEKETWLNWQGIRTLTKINLDEDFPEHQRILILAPHPDDEILGCAGLMQQLNALGREMIVIAITNGTASHPNSTQFSPEQLNTIRPQESIAALHILNLGHVSRIELNLPDGQISQNMHILVDQLKTLIQAQDILISTHEQDGHPDHELSAYAIKLVAQHFHLKHFQVFIWTWHWAKPNQADIDWTKAKRLDLSQAQIDLKERAIRCFKTQTQVDVSTGNPPILPEYAIQRILMPYEVYINEN
ncbi:PIG-L family deacetylase [Acinetobacter sp. 194]|uniref:PIG-L deacetylase family protein n=1 Tax=Acinetobacter shaoyimingii TaxID=2715164 RepID=UPI00140B4AD7|nr:PIG-L deacetylase family protein [Acinetobacter shaoyimingii]NHB58984.1 PIG-L family deacetylase [Acinetobacter shaoyimingii]